MKKGILLFFLLVALCVPFCSAANNGNVFEIYHAYENLEDMTLAEFSDACVTYLGLDSVTPAESTFSDLHDPDSNILRLVALGCIGGYGDGTVHPGEKVTYTRASIILGRLSRTLENYRVTDLYTSPDITPEMCSANYWISKIPNAYQTLLTGEQIETLNRESINREDTHLVDLDAVHETFDGISLANSLTDFSPSDTARVDGMPVQKSYWDGVRKNITGAKVSTNMTIRYGIAVNRTYMKDYPVDGSVSGEPVDPEWDDSAGTSLLVNEPVVVYFATADGKFYYVACDCYSGWARAEDIAICKSKAEWKNAWMPSDFLIVTGGRVHLEPSGSDPALSEKLLTIGTKLPLVKGYDGSSLVMNRIPWNNYIVRMPMRDENGNYYSVNASIPGNRQVHVGCLPLTRANLLTLAFQNQGDHYGWGGMLASLDCSDFTRRVYGCCGVTLPRNTSWQIKTPTKVSSVAVDAPMQEKEALLDATVPGSILYYRGHVMLYLGKVGEEYYVINSNLIVMQDGKTVVVQGIFLSPMRQVRLDGSTYMESFSTVIDPGAGYVAPAPETSATPQ